MGKTRVDLHKCYYFLYFSRLDGRVGVAVRHDTHNVEDNARFRSGNYYSSQKEAASLVHKLNAVLKGADVIKMPSEEEIQKVLAEKIPIRSGRSYADALHCCWFEDGIHWLQSKIVK